MIAVIGSDNVDFRRAADAAFRLLSLEGDAVVEAVFVTKEEIRELNARTRKVDKVTDVLSFPMLERIEPFDRAHFPYDYDPDAGGVLLGSVVICTDIAKEQAAEYGHSEVRETTYLFTHGLLHLLGYDHEEDNDRAVMREAEEKILSAIGVTE